MKVIHKQKNCNIPENETQLLNADGTWNIVCGRGHYSGITANKHWEFVTCKYCLKLKNRTKS